MEDVIGEDEEEARRPKIARRPQTPTKAAYDAHMTLHADYRIGVRTVLQEKASVTSTVHQRMKEQEGSSAWTMPS